ncbi:tRNA (5-methylaminomethyl-2-thiouridine)(34)-methyltransferase MnmD [Agrobacterium vitis]|uniref:tRNA (5-methylaminomethyl-2-thiouridine)(34)-methyltransferase MnmD n=1 Tax=Agrobacterium vitis TaxID=373 RepID=A0ABD6G4V6_AGRVI|nr:tRNA (5-methylaminomethyl-2-thiouridine)(34)-methyltransferase MnmD [Agrobacterium vitis]MUO80197.1 tRNA (5-methylaminomethyl-2-thiouridine)(34)-methyltransferase MnmD [Agrobacterium vitis]MUO97290.1 tRNA (5-methylaminomethyl-2-thiouridine)(34)-methyltransferase MnmD [Agrobacterium vitis]MUP03685.1 tRNA (5-methylaminomethyl-2-thiouridine)(34)-methyltransferase MnmD [Agrobacterium vitis]MUZ82633.1 tRNA (5-methylaminomethyl-2-thiouridine)(34)-methyltransferase MnmD [Agrobacterium vitis]MVA099
MTHSTSNPDLMPDAETAHTQPLSWQDGDMPYSTAFGDHFYCQTDGRLECGHVFLEGNGLPQRWIGSSSFRIGELGFGTGLNAMETWRQWQVTRMPSGHLTFISFELYPMARPDIDRALSRWPQIDAERQRLLALWPDEPQGQVQLDLDAQTRLIVVCGDALASLQAWSAPFDAWYLDGFAPSRNSAMWSLDLMTRLYQLTSSGGRFATYAAAGFVRRNLIAAGFTVERRPGFAGKREMLCGSKTEPS